MNVELHEPTQSDNAQKATLKAIQEDIGDIEPTSSQMILEDSADVALSKAPHAETDSAGYIQQLKMIPNSISESTVEETTLSSPIDYPMIM